MVGRKGPIRGALPPDAYLPNRNHSTNNRTAEYLAEYGAASALYGGPPAAPLRVSPAVSVFFNNLRCTPLVELLQKLQVWVSGNAALSRRDMCITMVGTRNNRVATPPEHRYDCTIAATRP